MTEIQMYSGKCKCKSEAEMRITDVKQDEKNPKSKIIAWMIYSYCDKCKIICMQGLFSQEEKPMEGRDYIIDWDKEVKR